MFSIGLDTLLVTFYENYKLGRILHKKVEVFQVNKYFDILFKRSIMNYYTTANVFEKQ